MPVNILAFFELNHKTTHEPRIFDHGLLFNPIRQPIAFPIPVGSKIPKVQRCRCLPGPCSERTKSAPSTRPIALPSSERYDSPRTGRPTQVWKGIAVFILGPKRRGCMGRGALVSELAPSTKQPQELPTIHQTYHEPSKRTPCLHIYIHKFIPSE